MASALVSQWARPLRVGLVGYGTIGKYVAAKLVDGTSLPRAELSAVLVRQERSEVPPELKASGAVFTTSREKFFAEPWDVAVEVAGQDAIKEMGLSCLQDHKRSLMITSVGALCDDALHNALLDAAGKAGVRLLIAAGALPAMDWMSSAALEELTEVTIVQTKRPEGWKGTPADGTVDLDALTGPTNIYEGVAREAATLFPKNANIAAAMALATVGLDQAKVVLVADPTASGPTMKIALKGAAGELDIQVRGKPAFGSQRTSMVVPLSVVKALKNLSSVEFVGI